MQMRTLFFSLLLLLLVQAQSLAATDSLVTKAPQTDPKESMEIGASAPAAPVSTQKKRDLADTVSYEADRIDYNAEAKYLLLTGNARIEYQKITLYADTITYFIDQNIFTASGLPQLIESGDTTVGDYMVYNIQTRRGRVNYASTRLSDASFNGNSIIKSEKDELYVDAGDYTTCAEIDTPHFTFYGRRIKIVPNDKIISKPVIFSIGEAPVAALPYFIFPIERKRRSGFLSPVWGGHPMGGGYLDNIGYYFAPNDYVDMTVATRVYEFQEFVANLSSSYSLKYKFNGSFSGRYAVNSDFDKQSREWALNYSHNQNLTPDKKTRLSGRGNLISQKNFFQRFSEDSSELREQNLSANLSLAHEIPLINGSFALNYDRKHNLKTDLITEDLPNFNFSLPDRPLIAVDENKKDDTLKWYNNIYWGYNARGVVKHLRPGSSNDSVAESFHPGLGQSLSLSTPQKLFKWITVNPSMAASNATFLGYIDTAVNRYDTLYDTVKYVIPRNGTDTRYTDYELVKMDTLSIDSQYALPDSIEITKYRKRSFAVHDTFNSQISNVPDWNAGINMSTKLYGMFPLRIFNFAGLRHTISPSINYTYSPERELDRRFYDVGIGYAGARKRSQSVNVSLGNQFDGKTVTPAKDSAKPVENKFTLLNCGVSAGYNFEAKHRKWSDLSMNANTSYKNIRLNASTSHWLYNDDNALVAPILSRANFEVNIGQLSAKGKLWGGDLLVLDSLQPDNPVKYSNVAKTSWSVTLSPSYSYSISRTTASAMFTPTKQYGLSSNASINLTRDWSFRWDSNYNFEKNQWVQNSININCDLECWDMQFQWRPESLNPGYYFRINIKKIPEIKWEQRRG